MFKHITKMACIAGFCLAATAQAAVAQDDPFEDGWTLNPEQSTLTFQSIKNNSVVESSTFATYSGQIGEDGTATLEVLLDSIDTKVDLRNVRMRFLFFETFQYPKATVTARLSEAQLADLATVRRKNMKLPFTLDLHGVSRDLVADVTVTLLSGDIVSVATTTPLSLAVADFNLMAGVEKLQEAANVQIVPSSSITFDFVFARNVEGGAQVAAITDDDDDDAPGQEDLSDNPALAAVETRGDFDTAACVGRFEILSRAGNIYFTPGSAQLDQKSVALLDTLYDVVSRCPDMVIEVGGHTDSDGSEAINQRLSEARAGSVVTYLGNRGIPLDRMQARGYGEAFPVVANDTFANKSRNRRIEFKVVGQQ